MYEDPKHASHVSPREPQYMTLFVPPPVVPRPDGDAEDAAEERVAVAPAPLRVEEKLGQESMP